VLTDAARIVRFWQAVETFNPRPLPKPDLRENVSDVRSGDPLPWEPGSRLAGRPPAAGAVWRHQVFGGLFELTAVRTALGRLYGDEGPGGDGPGGNPGADYASGSALGQSALFACTVDADGVLIGEASVSQCAWTLGMAAATGGDPGAWLTGCTPGAPDGLGGPGDPVDTGESRGRPLTGSGLRDFGARLGELFGVTALLSPTGLRVRSYQVPAGAAGAGAGAGRESTRPAQDDRDLRDHPLGSWFGGDLALVAGALEGRGGGTGTALADFLCSGEEISWDSRVDVRREPLAVRDGCAPERIPLGRWVADTGQPLVRSQQFAVNEIMARLAPGTGLFTVHAPPGTGTTAVFSDLIATIIVERARRLAELPAPAAAFGGSLTWQASTTTHTVTIPVPSLTGFEVVLACPHGPDGPDDAGTADIGGGWADQASQLDYFASTARLACGGGAWALIAARLGDGPARRDFAERFWQGTVRGTDALFRAGEPLPAALRKLAATAPDWPCAVTAFSEAIAKVNSLASERTVASASIARLSAVEQALEEAYYLLETAQDRCAELAGREVAVTGRLLAAEEARRAALAMVEAHLDDRPGLRAGVRASREWYATRGTLRTAYTQALLLRDATLADSQSLRSSLDAARRAVTQAEEEVGTLTAEMAALQEPVARVRRRWGNYVPDGPLQEETDDAALIERRETSAAWADEEFAAARTELFLAALALHKAFIAAQADTIEANLGTLMDILSGELSGELSGDGPPPEVTLAAWQSFFLVVPVVCATFASIGSLFAGLRRGSLGWLLGRRTGQVPPQQVLGALWRADRAVLAGDPLQAVPEGPLPWYGQQALLKALDVDEEWAPARGCAQRVADRLARHGTWLPVEAPDGSGRLWVGTPLRVQRRSDRPIIEACNEIAYDGLLICGAPPREVFPGADAWCDVRTSAGGSAGHRTGGHWIPAEGEALLSLLTSLRAAGVPAAQVRVVCLFPAVAAAAARVYGAVFGEMSADELRARVGTVHTVREGDVVILVLGGDPCCADVRAFASQAPNLLNSAVGRARRRLYVIGNRELWESQPYFEVLARRLADTEAAPTENSWGPRRNLAG